MIIFVLVDRFAGDPMHESGSENTEQSRRGSSPEEDLAVNPKPYLNPPRRSLRPQSAAVTRNPVPNLQLPRQGEGVLPESKDPKSHVFFRFLVLKIDH